MAFAAVSAVQSTTKLDMAMYNDVVFAQTGAFTNYAGASGGDALCTLRVHSVAPILDTPKVVEADFANMPSFMRKRLARRYEERGEPVPNYL